MLVWGAAYHAAAGIDMHVFKEFKDSRAVSELVRDHTAGNGMYITNTGVIAAVHMTPDLRDRSKDNMAGQLVKQYIMNAVAAALLAWLLLFTNVRTPLGAAGLFAAGGFTAGLDSWLPAWNWYGNSPEFVAAMILDMVAGFFFAGLVVGWARRKFTAG